MELLFLQIGSVKLGKIKLLDDLKRGILQCLSCFITLFFQLDLIVPLESLLMKILGIGNLIIPAS